MCDPVTAAVVLGGAALYEQHTQAAKAADAQSQANATATANANKAADQADQANNRANARRPDVGSLASQNAMAAKGGISGTMLTGSQGVDPKTLQLGKTTLLGS